MEFLRGALERTKNEAENKEMKQETDSAKGMKNGNKNAPRVVKGFHEPRFGFMR